MPKFPMKIEPETEPGDISKDVDLAVQISGLPSVDLKDAAAMADRVNWYFQFCVDHDERPCVYGLCLALGCARQSLLNWENENSERGKVVRRAKDIIRYTLEKWSLSGKLNPATSIFWAKNLLGYSDTIKIEASRDEGDIASLSPEEIARQIEENIPVDSVDAEYTESEV